MRSVTVFARRPRPGQVKTRLSPALPPDEACDLYRAMLLDAIAAAAHAGADRRLVYWADAGDGSEHILLPAGFEPMLQRGQDLGERLATAFAEMLPTAEDRAVVIGADCPDLDGAEIDAAFAALGRSDLVIAPAVDGGYALIGLSRPAPGLFEGIAWGGPEVFSGTLDRASSLGLSVAGLPPMLDVDTPGDLVTWIQLRLAWPVPGPAGARTTSVLRAMGLLP